jgi:hypothetical protein
MITPDEIRKKALGFYPSYLTSKINGEGFFPKIIRSDKKPSEKEIMILKKELLPLLENSKDRLGYGYIVKLKTIRSAKMGEQQLPEEIVFIDEDDYLKFLNKQEEMARFHEDSNLLLKNYPQLKPWITKFPLKLVGKSGYWEDLLKVLDYFTTTPKPNLYIRELPIAVHTKFVEQHASILDELLISLIPEHINHFGESFADRFSLKHYESYFHIRILDKNISLNYFSGLSDIGITPTELNGLNIPVTRVIIMENKQNYKNVDNFLSLPQMQGTIAIFGSGFRSGKLKSIHWLKEKELFYWGDIDTHGLQILSQVRLSYPNVTAWMMDLETLNHINHSIEETGRYFSKYMW